MLERTKSYIREHSSELAIFGIMTGIFVAIGLVLTGDISDAIARRGR